MEKLTKRKIETLKSFLTEEEAKEIIPLVKKYYGSHVGITLTDEASASNIIYWGINWSETPQGHAYWHKIRGKIIEREVELQKNN